ncbi:hypothetical protein ABZX69_32105 [Streptomyces sp. NPDC004074]|uniref:hypothetical protein n=1 Tax=Streptomyces sp. NPDC004074 TaxID=3154277 RepID=UPI0033B6579C
MTDVEPDNPDRKVFEQHNHGPGAFVAGDNHGHIGPRIEMLDAKTKAYLGRLSKDAPGLATLLRKALREGVISPDVADQLMLAARSINEDVAHSLQDASRRINWDVAALMSHAAEDLGKASARLNPDEMSKVVSRFEDGLENLERLASSIGELRRLPREIERLQDSDRPFGRIEQIGTVLSGVAERIEATVIPPPPRLIVDTRAQLKWFAWGLAIGMVFMFYLWHR